MSHNVLKSNVEFQPPYSDNEVQQFSFLQSRNVKERIKISIKYLSFHNFKNLKDPTDISVQLVEYISDNVLKKISNPLIFKLDTKNNENQLSVEIPFFISEIFSKDFKILIKLTNTLKIKDSEPVSYSLLINLSEGKVNKLCQGFKLFKFNDLNSCTWIYNNNLIKISENLAKAEYETLYLNKILNKELENLDDFMTFKDIEEGCNFILINFPKFDFPIIINDRIQIDNENFFNKPKMGSLPHSAHEPLLKNINNNQTSEFIKIGNNFNKLKFNDPLQYTSLKNPVEKKKQMVLKKKPYHSDSKKPNNALEPGYLTKVILERLINATKYNFNMPKDEVVNDGNDQNFNLFDDITGNFIEDYDISDFKWLNIDNSLLLHQILQENHKNHKSFKSKLVWGYKKFILNNLDADGFGMLTLLKNINWNYLVTLPKTFLLRKSNDLNFFYKSLLPIFEQYDFSKVSVEVLLQVLRFKVPLINDSIFQECIYYNEENTEEMRICIHSKLQSYLHQNFTIKIMRHLSLENFQLYLLHIVEGVCWDYKNIEYFDIEFDEEETEEDQELEEDVVIDGNKFSVPKSITLSDPSIVKIISPLADYLLTKGLKNFVEIGNHIYWYLKVQLLYSEKIQDLIDTYEYELTDDEKIILSLQKNFVAIIDSVNQIMKTYVPGTIKGMSKQLYLENLINTQLNSFIKKQSKLGNLLRLPILPNYKIIKINSDECKIFKSSLQPIKLSFVLEELSTNKSINYSVIYKNGDDLKQDQLISNIIKIMDSLLLVENVNLYIKTYDILPMGLNMGMIEFIESETVSNILSKDGTIKNFLSQKEKDIDVQKADITNTFVKSTAAYSIITYLLGVGDRHLENLLITPKGEFFHADFGYILGNDPKLFPPLMKLPPQIVEGFGGTKEHNTKYDEFRGYCFVCFLILRRNSGLLIDLFKFVDLNSTPIATRGLLKTGNQPISNHHPSNVEFKGYNNSSIDIVKNDYTKFVEKFQLEMSEDEAILYLQNLINSSINALLPLVIDQLHNLAQYWRN
ncbi:hypothetical protein QEN19_001955 [Hanseniaspora menglaensis]